MVIYHVCASTHVGAAYQWSMGFFTDLTRAYQRAKAVKESGHRVWIDSYTLGAPDETTEV